jgi:prepilin-type N-terminal cleavage/methylation domain-containing protein
MRKKRKRERKHSKNGFTLVEVLIAGAVMASTMMGIARFSGAALAVSSNQKDRQSLEAAINNNFQLIQQSDSQITKDRLQNNFFSPATFKEACDDAAQFLIDQISDTGKFTIKQPEILTTKTDYQLKRTERALNISRSQNSPVKVMEVTYEFESPEQSFGTETRTFEISPTFSSVCY